LLNCLRRYGLIPVGVSRGLPFYFRSRNGSFR